MDSGLNGFIATVEISMLMFPVPHSLQVHNGTNHIRNINLCINEFLMGFGRAKEARAKSSGFSCKFTGQEKKIIENEHTKLNICWGESLFW